MIYELKFPIEMGSQSYTSVNIPDRLKLKHYKEIDIKGLFVPSNPFYGKDVIKGLSSILLLPESIIGEIDSEDMQEIGTKVFEKLGEVLSLGIGET